MSELSTAANQNPIRVLLIENDEDDYVLVKECLSQVPCGIAPLLKYCIFSLKIASCPYFLLDLR